MGTIRILYRIGTNRRVDINNIEERVLGGYLLDYLSIMSTIRILYRIGTNRRVDISYSRKEDPLWYLCT